MSVSNGRATVATVNGSVVRTSSGSARSWRIRPWPNDPTVAHLIFVDHEVIPTPEAIDAAIGHAYDCGARALRTSALFPAAADVVLAAGFHPIDRLALLHMRLDGQAVARLDPLQHRVRTLHRWTHRRAAAIDEAAFGPMWGNDAASLRDIRQATPVHHARCVRVGHRLAAIALSGAAGENGYLQRVAVSPEHRRHGIARDLVIEALGWMHGQGRSRCLVNTGVDNVAALHLYEGLGFRRLADELTIAEWRLPG
jgi:ribosomal protein S18 acetylase RimI-like enzyme